MNKNKNTLNHLIHLLQCNPGSKMRIKFIPQPVYVQVFVPFGPKKSATKWDCTTQHE